MQKSPQMDRDDSSGDDPGAWEIDTNGAAGDVDGIPLQKWLAAHGVGSKAMIRLALTESRVTVDGEVVRRFAHPVGHWSEICLDGEPLVQPAPRCVYLMHKPRKHLTQQLGDGDAPGLGHYLPADAPRVFAVGRLDFNTEGALLWTNDGRLARRILDPVVGLTKEYHVKVRDHLAPDDPGLERIRQGLRWERETYRPAPCEILAYRTRATWVRIVLTEGRYHEVRRMCAANRWQIVKLRRAAVGPIVLGDLNPRCVRRLTDAEVDDLRAAVGLGGSESEICSAVGVSESPEG